MKRYPSDPQLIAEEMADNGLDAEHSGDAELIRRAIIAEFDAINLYEQIANKTKDPFIERVMLDVSREEKVHVGEFQKLLARVDPDDPDAVEEGEQEVDEMEES